MTFFQTLQQLAGQAQQNLAAYKKHWTKERRLQRIRRVALADFNRAAATLSDHTDEDLKVRAASEVGSWKKLEALDKSYHQKLLQPLVFLARKDPASAQRVVLKRSEAICDRFLKKFNDELHAKEMTFRNQLSQMAQDWVARQNPGDPDQQQTDASAYRQALEDQVESHTRTSRLFSDERAKAYRSQLERTYDATLCAGKKAFLRDLRQEKYQLKNSRAIMQGGATVDLDAFSESFLATDKHLMDRVQRNWTLVQPLQSEEGAQRLPALGYRLLDENEGGDLAIGLKWFSAPDADDETAQGVDQDSQPSVVSDSATKIQDQSKFLFADQILLPTGLPACTPIKKVIACEKADGVDPFLLEFAVNTAGQDGEPLSYVESAVPGLPVQVISQFLQTWFSEGDDRKIAFILHDDGLVFVHIEMPNATPAQTKAAHNHVRLVALLVVATVSVSINGKAEARAFPEIRDPDKSAIHIPSECVWPIEVRRPRTKIRLETLKNITYRSVRPKQAERWMAGYLPISRDKTDLYGALCARHVQNTLRHGRVLFQDKHASEERFGRETASAADGIRQHFGWSCLVLATAWFAMVLLSFLPNQIGPIRLGGFIVLELQLLTILFGVISLWLIFVSYLFIAELNSIWRTGGSSHRWAKVRRRVVNIAFSGPLALWALPMLFGALILAALGTQGKPLWLDLLGFGMGTTRSTVSYKSTLSGAVWALPVLCFGLLNQARLALDQALMDQEPIHRIERSIKTLKKSNEVATQLYPKEDGRTDPFVAPKTLLNRLQAGVDALKKDNEKRYGAKSTLNAGVIALLALSKPLAQLQPETAKPDMTARMTAVVNDGSGQPEDFRRCMSSALSRTQNTLGGMNATELPIVLAMLSTGCIDQRLTVANYLSTYNANTLWQVFNREQRPIAACQFSDEPECQKDPKDPIIVDIPELAAIQQELENIKQLVMRDEQTTTKQSAPDTGGTWLGAWVSFMDIGALVDKLRRPNVIAAPSLNVTTFAPQSSALSPFEHCEGLAYQLYAHDESESGNWTLGPHRRTGIDDWETFSGKLEDLARLGQLFVLGLADGVGDMTHNLDLAHQRALKAIESLKPHTNAEIIPVSLGSYGWLIDESLPKKIDKEEHRSASLFFCASN